MPIHKIKDQKIFIDGTPIEEYIDMTFCVEPEETGVSDVYVYTRLTSYLDLLLKRGRLEISEIPSYELEDDAIYIWGVFIALKPLEKWQIDYLVQHNINGTYHSRSRIFSKTHAIAYKEFWGEFQELKDLVRSLTEDNERLLMRLENMELNNA